MIALTHAKEASQPGGSDPAASRSSEFSAIEGGREHYDGPTLLVGAYAAVWVILMAWLALMWRKQQTLKARVIGLEAAIERAASAQSATSARTSNVTLETSSTARAPSTAQSQG